jgi:hypothetical protein
MRSGVLSYKHQEQHQCQRQQQQYKQQEQQQLLAASSSVAISAKDGSMQIHVLELHECVPYMTEAVPKQLKKSYKVPQQQCSNA